MWVCRHMNDMLGGFGDLGQGWGAAMEAVLAPVKVGRRAILQAFDNLLAFCRVGPWHPCPLCIFLLQFSCQTPQTCASHGLSSFAFSQSLKVAMA